MAMNKKTFMAAIITATLLFSFAVGAQTVQLAKADSNVSLTLTVSSPTQNATYTTFMEVSAFVGDNVENPNATYLGGDSWYRIDNNTNVEDSDFIDYGGTANVYIGDLTNGTHQLTITAQVQYGLGPTPAGGWWPWLLTTFTQVFPPINFTVYNIPPTFNVISPQNMTYNTNNVTLDVYLHDPSTGENKYVLPPVMEYSIDNQSNQHPNMGGLDLPLPWTDGSHSVTFYAFGQNKTVFFTVDTTTPNISDLSIENETYLTTDIPLSFNTNESTSWLGYRLDNQANQTVNGNFTLEGLTEGAHSLVIYANDTFGNMGKSDTVYFTVANPTPSPKSIEYYVAEWIPYAIIALVIVLSLGVLVYFKQT